MADVEPGKLLGDRFEVVGVLGHGGMATVYLAEDRLRGEPVALKVLHGHLAKSASWRSRLRREVAAASRLRHPNALVASDLHEVDGTLAVSMPLHPGQTLAEHVERHGPLTGPALERIARQIASALREAHAAGLVHRDVTPTNVMVDDEGDAALTDFGLARFADQRTATATGALGTAGYAAPEVYQGVRGDPRSDLYGLGAILYQAATGSAPFAARDPVGVLQKQLADNRVPLATARPDLPAHLSGLVDRLLAPDPEARPQGAAEVVEILERKHLPAERPAPKAAPKGPIGPARAPHLPHGSWTVLVAEGRRDRERRRALRKRLERQRAADFGADVERAVEEVKKRVLGLMNIPSARLPEQAVADAVAREAGLPPGSLTVPRTMLERRFRLVESVSEASARRLAEAARDQGFEARPMSPAAPAAAAPDRDFRRRVGLAIAAAAVVVLAIVGIAVAGLLGFRPESMSLPDIVSAVPIPFVFFLFVLFGPHRGRGWSAESFPRDLPVAFGKDLRFHLAPDADVTLVAPAEEAPEPPEAPAEPVPDARAPRSRHGAVIERAQAQLIAFGEAVEGARAHLPDAAIRDLRGTLADLRGRVEALGAKVLALESALASLDDAASAAAIDRIEARLERLRTLARAGRAGEDVEVGRLEQALASHRTVIEQSEALEGQLTLAVARLLETGATAARARVELLDAPEPAHSADDLLARLRAQTDGARAALAELEGQDVPRLPKEPLGAAARLRPSERDRA